MRFLLHLITTALVIAATSFAFAQGASIQIEQPWSRATTTGASTGAVYLTITNKSHDADRLLGASSDVADKSQIHEMKVVNGSWKCVKLGAACSFPPALPGSPCSATLVSIRLVQNTRRVIGSMTYQSVNLCAKR
jgi:copper(I)-binding protein